MSRIAKAPVFIPTGVEVKINGQYISIIGKNGQLTHTIHENVCVQQSDQKLLVFPRGSNIHCWAFAGTTSALLKNMVIGVTEGFIKKLQLVGVGYRAVINNNEINLYLGFSHLIDYKLPLGVTAECPSQTEIVLKGIDKQLIGQVAADLRAYRRLDPYKGKGIRYIDEVVRLKKETKKK